MLGRVRDGSPGYESTKVAPRWKHFVNFLADMGVRPKGKTLDRKNGSLDYTPDNCRWATPTEQNYNRFKRGKLNQTDVAWIRWLLTEGNCPGHKVAKMYGVSANTISAIHTRKTWND